MKALRCGKVIDGRAGRAVENAVILIEGSKIVSVGEESEVDVPRGIEEIDCSRETVVPGFIDPHLHFALGPGDTYEDQMRGSNSLHLVSGVVNARFTLESGVTTARDLGARDRVALDLREAARKGLILAPRLLVCGRPITMTGGHFYFCNAEADGFDGVRKVTRQLLKEGVDFIKIMASGGGTVGTRRELASYTTEELQGAVNEAHRWESSVTAHCHATQAIANAIDAGVDVIEHCSFLEPGDNGFRHEFQEDLAREMVMKGIYIDNVLSTSQYRLEASFENFRRLIALGAKILPGTDGLRLYETAGLALYLELMVRGGMTPMEALVSATQRSAEAIGVGDLVGSIEAGKEADFVVVDGDPLQEIRVLRSPKLVIQGGSFIPLSGRGEAQAAVKRVAEQVGSSLDELGI